MTRGDVVWITLAAPDPENPTHLQRGRRPAVIIQAEAALSFTRGGNEVQLRTVIVAPITSRLAAARFPGAFEVAPSAGNGLREPSVVLVHQTGAIDRVDVDTPVAGRLDSPDLERLNTNLRFVLGL